MAPRNRRVFDDKIRGKRNIAAEQVISLLIDYQIIATPWMTQGRWLGRCGCPLQSIGCFSGSKRIHTERELLGSGKHKFLPAEF